MDTDKVRLRRLAMNFSAIFIDIASHAVRRAYEDHAHAYAIYEAIVFSWLALEALINSADVGIALPSRSKHATTGPRQVRTSPTPGRKWEP